MKKVTLAIALAALVLFAGCKKDTTTTMTSTLKASIEQNQGDGSRTALNPTNGAITWNAGDQILVSNGSSTKTFTLTGEAGQTIGTFTCSGEYALGTNNMAVYPATGTFSGNTLSVTLPADQNGTLGTFANGANPMLAVSETDNLTFTSLCGVLGLSLKGDNIAITAIEVVDNGTGDNSMLCGAFTADCTANQPVLAYAGNGGTNSVILNCATTLTSEAKEFYIVLPVGTLASANGFTMNLYNGAADPIFSKTRGAALEMQYNTVRKMNTINVTLAPAVTVPEVTTGTATAIPADGATCAGTVTSDGNGTISAYGITYSTTDGFDGATGTPVAGGAMDGAGDFSAILTGLTDNTTYYYRAYATNEAGTTYGDIASFTTPVAISLPWVTTASVTDITANSALVGGTITNDGNGTISARGVSYKIAVEDNWTDVVITSTNATFSTTLNLSPSTTYVVRAYATNEAGTGYGEETTFATLSAHPYVDLGLPSGLLWATCNVGADSPEDYGDYFAWGETTPKSTYTWDNYQFGTSTALTKYNESDGLTTLLPEDDAATANWGDGWRMPTRVECQELLNNTTWSSVQQNGVDGLLITGPNGNSIFLPWAGRYDGSNLQNAGRMGYFWMNVLNAPKWARCVNFSYSAWEGDKDRYCGYSVRPVRDAE